MTRSEYDAHRDLENSPTRAEMQRAAQESAALGNLIMAIIGTAATCGLVAVVVYFVRELIA